MLGFHLVFVEADESSGLKRLKLLAQNELREQAGVTEKLAQIQTSLDYDALFAKSIEKRPVVMGYHMTSDRDGRTSGVLPAPVMGAESLRGNQHTDNTAELKTWALALQAYRMQDWDRCDVQLLNLQRQNAKKYLYQLYAERVASMRLLPFDPEWDGATNFQTK